MLPGGIFDSPPGGVGTDDQTAAEVPFTPAGSIAATDVQAAIEEVAAEAGGGGLFESHALIREEQAAGTMGGTFTTGAWRTRTLNTEEFDPDGIVTISSNQFTPVAGTYKVVARATAYRVYRHVAKIRNVTDSVDEAVGMPAYSADDFPGQAMAFVTGRFTTDGTKVYELQHQGQQTNADRGFGIEANLGLVEVFSEVELLKET